MSRISRPKGPLDPKTPWDSYTYDWTPDPLLVRSRNKNSLTARLERLEATPDATGPAVDVMTAARLLGCGRTAIFRFVRLGVLKLAKKTGKKTMLLRESVERLARSGPVGRR